MLRCAIYTRKSTEEGLDQDFNSLHAQREACEAYIRSQSHEGWRLLPDRFDDGGYSGGTLERPGLKALLEAIRARKIDVIVIYKIDRLTRSLTDFARLAELLDSHQVSFVSVTQQFNTTTSMGRLMLNVLLSFAQFEREITGERIRDKISASKKKGLWMGGITPLGYKVKNRQLVIEPQEAETVRRIFRLYGEYGSVTALQSELQRQGITTKCRMTSEDKVSGGKPFSRGHLYKVLSNPLYIGQVKHKDKIYPGQHEAIIEISLWKEVQDRLATNRQGVRRSRTATFSRQALLAGLLVDEAGEAFSLNHARKGTRRYRYYVQRTPETENTPPLRLPASLLECLAQEAIEKFLTSSRLVAEHFTELAPSEFQQLITRCEQWKQFASENRADFWRSIVCSMLRQVVFRRQELNFIFNANALREQLGLASGSISAANSLEYSVPIRFSLGGQRLKLVLANAAPEVSYDATLIRTLARAHDWLHRLKTGQADSLSAIARQEGLSSAYVSRVVKLTFLAPDIAESILNGTQPEGFTAERLTLKETIPLRWQEQRTLWGFGNGK